MFHVEEFWCSTFFNEIQAKIHISDLCEVCAAKLLEQEHNLLLYNVVCTLVRFPLRRFVRVLRHGTSKKLFIHSLFCTQPLAQCVNRSEQVQCQWRFRDVGQVVIVWCPKQSKTKQSDVKVILPQTYSTTTAFLHWWLLFVYKLCLYTVVYCMHLSIVVP
jgi:hypothetical protein